MSRLPSFNPARSRGSEHRSTWPLGRAARVDLHHGPKDSAALTIGILVSIAGCGGSAAPLPAPPPPAAPPPRVPAAAPARPTSLDAVWSGIRTTPGCFFFSGPENLGRDTHLGADAAMVWEGDRVTLFFPPEAADFEGALDPEAGRLRVERRAGYDFDAKWEVREVIEGVWAGGGFDGTYHYEECTMAAFTPCAGKCTIDARLVLRAR